MMSIVRTSVLWLASTHAAFACAVCGGGGPNRQAFIDTMIVMSLFPLAMMGGFVGFLWWRNKQLNELPPRPPLDAGPQEA